MGYFLTADNVDISLVDDKGNQVPVRFNQVPSPSTTINSQTYTSGVTWSFEAGLSGGAAGARAFLEFRLQLQQFKDA